MNTAALRTDAPSSGHPDLSHWFPDQSRDLLDCTLGDLLRKPAFEVPDRHALVEGVADPTERRRWTYCELLRDLERMARALLGLFKPGECVAVYATNSPEWVLLQHGMSLAGLRLSHAALDDSLIETYGSIDPPATFGATLGVGF